MTTTSDRVLMDPARFRDMPLGDGLTNRLSALGLEWSDELWVLAVGYLAKANLVFDDLLEKVSRDVLDRGGPPKQSKFEARMEISSIATTDDADQLKNVTTTCDPSDNAAARILLSIMAPRSRIVYWEATFPVPCEWLAMTPDPHDATGAREFCRYFLDRARDGQVKHWSVPPVYSWSELLRTSPFDAFLDWLCLAIGSRRDLEILQERLGLQSGKRKTLNKVGLKFGLTRERVRQVMSQILRRLTHPRTRKRLASIEATLNRLFEQHGGIMSVREVKNAAGFLADFEGFSPLAVAGLILHCCPSFHPLDYDYESGSGASSIQDVTWHTDEIRPTEITTVRTIAMDLVAKDPCRYSLDELVTAVSTESGVLDRVTSASIRTYRGIRPDSSGLMILNKGAGQTGMTISQMAVVALREIGVPAHYTVIAKKMKEIFPKRDLQVNHVLNYLGGPPFRWVDKGTYGLAEWRFLAMRSKEKYKVGQDGLKRCEA